MSADPMMTVTKRALERSRDQFLSYAEQHNAKGTPEAALKAQVNRGMAEMCAAALADNAKNPPATGGLRDAVLEACDLLAERTHGSPARSPAHNARLMLEGALKRQAGVPAFAGQLFAQPRDCQGRVGLLRFCDQDMRDMHFDDPADAWEAWNQYSRAWNCTLLLAAELPQPIAPATRAENAQVAARPAPRHPEGMKNAIALIEEAKTTLGAFSVRSAKQPTVSAAVTAIWKLKTALDLLVALDAPGKPQDGSDKMTLRDRLWTTLYPRFFLNKKALSEALDAIMPILSPPGEK